MPGKVLVAFHEPVLGGATLSVLRIVEDLTQRGWTFSFWVSRPSQLYDELENRGFDVAGAPRFVEYSVRSWRLPPGPRKRMASVRPYLRAYRSHLTETAPDLVHANTIICIAEALVAKRDGHKVLLHVHEMIPGGVRGVVMRELAWRFLDSVVAVSSASGARMALRGNKPQIVFEAAPIPDHPVEIRRSPRPFRVGTVAVVSSRKGSDLFVSAAERLLASETDRFEFEMIGAPSDALERDWAESLISRASELGIKHQHRSNVASCLEHWDAFVLPSRADPFPISMLEAMAAGLPVIGTRVDGLAEQITPDCGILVPPDDPSALALAIERIASESAEVRAAMGRAGRERVMANHSLRHQADALESVYSEALR